MSDLYETEHGITVFAPADTVFELIANITAWPRIFPPTVHAEYVEQGHTQERIRLWATANGVPKTWTSHRTLDRENRRIRFRQERSQSPLAAMGGEWRMEPSPDGNGSRVVLTHDFRPQEDTAATVAWINQAVDRNSRAELDALKAAAERENRDDLLVRFEDTLQVEGPASDLYDFLYRADLWPERLPHVARLDLTEEPRDVQAMAMDTRAEDGSVHTTESVRVCLPPDTIVYKQLRTPALLTVHTGCWTVRPDGGGTTMSSAHTVVIDPEAIPRVLGHDATVAQARAFVRGALGRNSMATLRQAKSHVEQAHKIA